MCEHDPQKLRQAVAVHRLKQVQLHRRRKAETKFRSKKRSQSREMANCGCRRRRRLRLEAAVAFADVVQESEIAETRDLDPVEVLEPPSPR